MATQKTVKINGQSTKVYFEVNLTSGRLNEVFDSSNSLKSFELRYEYVINGASFAVTKLARLSQKTGSFIYSLMTSDNKTHTNSEKKVIEHLLST